MTIKELIELLQDFADDLPVVFSPDQVVIRGAYSDLALDVNGDRVVVLSE